MEDLHIKDAKYEDLISFFHMERASHANGYVGNYALEKHQEEFAKPSVFYKSIYQREKHLVGFIILVLDPDGESLEFRRIVASEPGSGIGSYTMKMLPKLCHDLGRKRIWLDVYEHNTRARHVYEKGGFVKFGEEQRGERTLLLYHRAVCRRDGAGGRYLGQDDTQLDASKEGEHR